MRKHLVAAIACSLFSSASAIALEYVVIPVGTFYSDRVNRWGVSSVDGEFLRYQVEDKDLTYIAGISSGAGPMTGRALVGASGSDPNRIFDIAAQDYTFNLISDEHVEVVSISDSGVYVVGNAANGEPVVWVLSGNNGDVTAAHLPEVASIPLNSDCVGEPLDELETTVIDINNEGEAIGVASCSFAKGTPFPIFWPSISDAAQPLSSADPARTAPSALNNAGQIVGASGDDAVFWSDGNAAPTNLGEGYANDINDSGLIVGSSDGLPVVWLGSQKLQLNDLIVAPFPTPLPTLLEAYAVGDCGHIVGYSNMGGFIAVPWEDDDADRDQLKDRWETCGIDAREVDPDANPAGPDGITDFVLVNANPKRADLYVETDSMEFELPDPVALENVVAAFGAAPVNEGKPGLTSGIALHIPCDQDPDNPSAENDPCIDDFTIPEATWALSSLGVQLGGDFAANRPTYFGSAAERAHANKENILKAKAYTHKYSVFIRNYEDHGVDDGSSGAAPGTPSAEFAVSLGDFPADTPDEQAGAFMHELGHTLGLKHGGGDEINYKPNYFSVMNYLWELPIRNNVALDGPDLVDYYATWKLTYSVANGSNGPGGFLRTLDETNTGGGVGLSEPDGIGSSMGGFVPIGPADSSGSSMDRLVSMSYHIDWNGDSDDTDTGVVEDTNDLVHLGDHSLDILDDHDDWASIVFITPPNDAIDDGQAVQSDLIRELTLDEFMTLSSLSFDCNGNGVDDDGEIANGTLPDVNGNGVADACDGEPAPDLDGDGINDDIDNCIAQANPLQEDSDFDRYGNACDADLNNDCVVNFLDVGLLKQAFFSDPTSPNWNPNADLNSDGAVNFLDLGILRSFFFDLPGPSADTTRCDEVGGAQSSATAIS